MVSQFHTGTPTARGRVATLAGGRSYFDELAAEMDRLQAGDKLCLMKWHIHPHFRMPGNPNDPAAPEDEYLSEKLYRLHERGVDVRILLWINTNVLRPQYFPFIEEPLNEHIRASAPLSEMRINAVTVPFWRDIFGKARLPGTPNLADRIMVNTLDAFGGGCHAKFALLLRQVTPGSYEGLGYTGGIDLGPNRYAVPLHQGKENYWHDIQAAVQGSAAIQQMARFFEEIWNENVSRRADGHNPLIHLTDNVGPDLDYGPFPAVPANADFIDLVSLTYADTTGNEPHDIQSLRTLPKILPGFGEQPISFAPDGHFEFRAALKHAIRTAKKYIYIEDQAMESLEIFDMLREALEDTNRPNLQVIVFTGTADPADGPRKRLPRTLLAWYFFEALVLPSRKARFHYFESASYVVHSKVFVFDDEFAIVGSAGMFTRSLTQELEHAVAFSEREPTPANGNVVRTFREQLWSEVLQVQLETYQDKVKTLDQALAIWTGTADPIVPGAPDLVLPVFARKSSYITDDGLIPDAYLPVIEGGSLRTDDLLDDEVDRIIADNDIPAKYTVTDRLRVFVRTFDWTPKIMRLVVGRHAPPGNKPFVIWDVVDPRSDGTENLAPVAPPTLAANTVSDQRLVTEETNPVLLSSGDRAVEAIGLDRAFYDHSILMRCTSGTNTGEVRRVDHNTSGTLSVAELPDPDATTFSYKLLYPKIRKVDLFRYRDPEMSGTYLFEAAWHLLSHEVLFSAMFNEDKALPLSVPVPVGRPAAINEKVTLRTLASDGTVTWRADTADAVPQTGSGATFDVQFTTPGAKSVTALQTRADGTEIPYTFEVQVLHNSGRDWWEKFPNELDLQRLEPSFLAKVAAFITALAQEGIAVNVISVYRPPERAYLMHYANRIARGYDPAAVDVRHGKVDISWKHFRTDGTYDAEASVTAATELASRYGVYVPGRPNPSQPAFPTTHSEGKAIDMKFTWTGEKVVQRGDGLGTMTIRAQNTSLPNDPAQSDLSRLGRTYGVIRRKHQSNHWSVTGG